MSRLLDASFDHESRRCEACSRTEIMAEAALAHSMVDGQRAHRHSSLGRGQHTLPYTLQQTLSLSARVAEVLRQTFVRQDDVEKVGLDVEPITEVLVKCPAHEAHHAGYELTLGFACDRRPGSRHMGLDSTDEIRVIDADPRKRPAGRVCR